MRSGNILKAEPTRLWMDFTWVMREKKEVTDDCKIFCLKQLEDAIKLGEEDFRGGSFGGEDQELSFRHVQNEIPY